MTRDPELIVYRAKGVARNFAFPIGLQAGLMGSVVGVGGGVLIVPWLMQVSERIPQRVASGTSLVAVLATGLVSMYAYGTSDA